MTRLVVTTSWDDGHPADLRLAALLAKYGAAGTFYVPNRNAEGRPVLSERDVRELSSGFEIGGHSIDHIVLTNLENEELKRQIGENKRWLEGTIGKPVKGFCYVRGRYHEEMKDIVRQAGFDYARTVENLHASATADPYELPTTVQLYPHTKTTYLKNFASGQITATRMRLLWTALSSGDLVERIEQMARVCGDAGGYFHLWGHSWEIEEHGLWSALENALKKLAAMPTVEFMTNHQVFSKYFQRPPSA